MAETLVIFLWVIVCAAVTVTQGQFSGGGNRTVLSVEPGDTRVKVFHSGSWGYICANNWDSSDAQVVCRMQGFWHGKGTADLRALEQGQPIWLSNVNCVGTESDISECRFQGWGQQQCPIGAVGAVSCDVNEATRVKLVDGYGPWEGRLEIERGGLWRPVCKDGFGDLDAQVVCRMLGVRGTGGTAHTEQKFGQGATPPVVRQLECTGAESDLSQCKGTSTRVGEQCDSAGVECYSCGALLTTESGTVESDGYPLSYPGHLNCLYVIRPINDQLLYKLEFSSNFSTEACCDTLAVKVLSGPSNVPTVGAARYAGLQAPPRLLGKAFALNFVTDGSNSLQGFQAHWSPASVQDVVSVTCHAGHFTVDIDLTFLRRLFAASSQQTIALADPQCTGQVTSENGDERLIITSETDSCGTKIRTTPTTIEYNNFLVDRVYARGSTVIVRERRWEIPVHCSVPRTDDLEVHYNPFPDVGKRELLGDPEGDLKAESEHARDRREVRGQLAVSLDFPITLTAYTNTSYMIVSPIPLHRRLKEELALRVQLQGADADLKMVLQNCRTRPMADSTLTYYIIRNGCAVDAATQILDTQPHRTDFRFTAFEFAGDFPEVYIDCDVSICPANDNGPACLQQCVASAAPVVGKREAGSPIFGDAEIVQYNVDFGPVVIMH